jgi:hypothetical protein
MPSSDSSRTTSSPPLASSYFGASHMHQLGSHLPSRRGERGAALVEFALVLPIFLLLLVGMMHFGKALNYWIDATHLSNIAARQAAVNKNPNSSGTLQEYIQQRANTLEFRDGGTDSVPSPGLEVCIDFPGATSKVGEPVEAKVSATYNWLPIISERIGIGQSTIEGTAVMRLEATPTNYGAGCAA